MSLLLSFEQQKAIKEISQNNAKKYNQIAIEVESLELDKLLGYTFYQQVASHPEDYEDLLNGCTFEDIKGNTVSHKGLRYVLAYLNYSAYIAESFVNDTFTGLVQKNRPDSESVSQGVIKNLQSNARAIAFNAFDLTKMYIELNYEKYPHWSRLTSNKRTQPPKFYGVKKTIL